MEFSCCLLTHKSNRLQIFRKIDVSNITGTQQCWSLFLITLLKSGCFTGISYPVKFLKTTFYETTFHETTFYETIFQNNFFDRTPLATTSA